MLKRTIIQKIVKAVDTKYLAALCNTVTGQIVPLVPTILDFLYDNYGRITPQQLGGRTNIVKSMTYDPSQPIDLIFNSIDDLVKYALSAKGGINPKSDNKPHPRYPPQTTNFQGLHLCLETHHSGVQNMG